MKIFSYRWLWLLLAAAGFVTLSASNAPAQRPTAPAKNEFIIKRIEVRYTNPPTSSGQTGRGTREAAQLPWPRFECEFESTPDWADEVQVKWYVVLQSPRKIMGTGDDTYNYVHRGRHHIAAMFMHPFVMERWTGGVTQQAIQDVGVEIWWQGRLVTFSSKGMARTQWWQQFQPTSGLLMRVSESPWAMASFTEYEWSKYTTATRP